MKIRIVVIFVVVIIEGGAREYAIVLKMVCILI